MVGYGQFDTAINFQKFVFKNEQEANTKEDDVEAGEARDADLSSSASTSSW